MIETAIEITGVRIDGARPAQIVGLGKELLRPPGRAAHGVAEAVDALADGAPRSC